MASKKIAIGATCTIDAALAQRKLAKMAKAMTDRVVTNQKVSIALQGIVFRNFETESNDGVAWAPFKAGGRWTGTKKAGNRKFDANARLLQNTGAMRNSFLPFWDNDTAGVGALSGKRHAELSKIHQEGLGNVPPRPMLPTRPLALKTALVVYGQVIAEAQNG